MTVHLACRQNVITRLMICSPSFRWARRVDLNGSETEAFSFTFALVAQDRLPLLDAQPPLSRTTVYGDISINFFSYAKDELFMDPRGCSLL